MLGTVKNIVDIIINLSNFKEAKFKKQKRAWEYFIVPIQNLINELHIEYCNTFSEYKEYIEANFRNKEKMAQLAKIIEGDSLKAFNIRSALASKQAVLTEHSLFGEYARLVMEYLKSTNMHSHKETNDTRTFFGPLDLARNIPRFRLYGRFSSLFLSEEKDRSFHLSDERKKMYAVKLINYILKELSIKYHRINIEYEELKYLCLS